MAVLARQNDRKKAGSALQTLRAVIAWEVRGVVISDAGAAMVVDDLDQRARLELHIERTPGGAVTIEPRLALANADGAPCGAAIALPPPDPAELQSARWIEDHQTGLHHVDAGGLLRATWRRGLSTADCGTLLYAGTSLFRAIGVPGGRCESPRLTT